MHRVSKEVIKAIHAQVMFRDCMNATLFTLLLRRIADAVIIRADKKRKQPEEQKPCRMQQKRF